MTEVLFYHLTQDKLEKALPTLLEKSVAKGWNVVVQAASSDLTARLDEHLWTYRADSFLAHGKAGSDKPDPAQCPIWITTDTENPNSAAIRFIVEGAIPAQVERYERVIYMFDGFDDDAVAAARERWKIEKAAGHMLTYWQQDEAGRWAKKA
ncbi:MAG: DNA polymerase III subunit chi [Pseudomonadota bacterium]